MKKVEKLVLILAGFIPRNEPGHSQGWSHIDKLSCSALMWQQLDVKPQLRCLHLCWICPIPGFPDGNRSL